MYYWQQKKVRATNLKLLIKTEILDDRSDPKILFDLNDGRQLEVSSTFIVLIPFYITTGQDRQSDVIRSGYSSQPLLASPCQGGGGDRISV